MQIPNFGGLKSANGHVLDTFYPYLGKIPSDLYRGHYLRAPLPEESFALPSCGFFCKLVPMSNFGGLQSANGHVLDRLFPNMG